jgi:uncharacterized protein YukE
VRAIIVSPAALRAAAAAAGRSGQDLDQARAALAQQLAAAAGSWSPAGESVEQCGRTSLLACERLVEAHRNLARALSTIADTQEQLESKITAATGVPDAPPH